MPIVYRMLDFLLTLLNNLVHDPQWVYTFLFFDALLTTVPILGTVVLETPIAVVAGFLASQGYFSLTWAMVWGIVGGVVGDGLGYHLGRRVGLRLVNTPWIASHRHFETAHRFFQAHGEKSIIAARFIGPLRTVIPLIAGIVHMPPLQFWFYNVISAIIWGFVFFPLGFYFGKHWEAIVHWAERGGGVALLVIILVGLWYVRRSRVQLPTSNTQSPTSEPSTSPNEEKNV